MELREEVVQLICSKTAELIGRKPEELSEQTVFTADLDIKSADVVLLIAVLEDAYEIDIDYMQFRKRNTIGEAADYIAELCGA